MAEPDEDHVKRVFDALMARPELAYGVYRSLLTSTLLGPWQDGTLGMTNIAFARKKPGYGDFACLMPVKEGREVLWNVGSPRAFAKGRGRSFADAMNQADAALTKAGFILSEPIQPRRVATPWMVRNGAITRYHDVPSKLTQLPPIATITHFESGAVKCWTGLITVQGAWGTTGEPQEFNHSDLASAKDNLDSGLHCYGWILPERIKDRKP